VRPVAACLFHHAAMVAEAARSAESMAAS
jgi:hypothetical protein